MGWGRVEVSFQRAHEGTVRPEKAARVVGLC